MSSVHDRLAKCEQSNGGHLEGVTSGMKGCVFFVLFCFKTTDSLVLKMLKYVLPYKCNCIMISNTFNFLTLKNRPIRWRTLYLQISELSSEIKIFNFAYVPYGHSTFA